MTASEAKVLKDRATPRGKYPHARRGGDYIFVSGVSARQPDNAIAGAQALDDMGSVRLDIRAQTRAVLDNIAAVLAEFDATLDDLVEISVFLVNMNDFAGYNETYGEVFDHDGPARTTVAVRQLPHPWLLIEMKAIAYKPAPSSGEPQ